MQTPKNKGMSNTIGVIDVSLLLLGKGTVLYDQIDVQGYVDQAFRDLGNPSLRGGAFLVLSEYFEWNNNDDKKVFNLLDRLPLFIETAKMHEQTNLLGLIKILSNVESIEIQNHWSKIISKIMTQSIKSANQHKCNNTRISFLFSLFNILLVSKLRMMLSPYCKPLKDLSLSLLPVREIDYDSLISPVFALSCCLDSPELWSSSFVNIVELSIWACNKLLIPLPICKTMKFDDKKFPFLLQSINEASGVAKALIVKSCFHRTCTILNEMIRIGCSGGLINMDLTLFLNFVSNLLSYYSVISTSDTKVFIENAEKISQIDIFFILSQLKISILQPLTSLLRLNLAIFIRYGTALLQPVFSLLARSETHRVPALFQACLTCLIAGIECLPNTAARIIENGSTVLQDLFAMHICLVASNRSMVTANSVVTNGKTTLLGKRKHYEEKDVEDDNDDYSVLVFRSVECLLRECGALLPLSAREFIEQQIKIGLSCLDKGILNVSLFDRRVKRNRCERLRQSAKLLEAFVVVAIAEILAPSKSGIISSNLSRFRTVCSSVTMSPFAGSDLKSIATTGLLMIGHILQPTSIPIPSIAPAEAAAHYLVTSLKQEKLPITSTAHANVDEHRVTSKKEDGARKMPLEFKSVFASKPETQDASQLHVQTEEKNTVSDIKIDEKKPTLSSVQWNENILRPTDLKSAKTVENDLDDDLPDIEIDSD